MLKKLRILPLILLLVLSFAFAASAQEAEDLTKACTITSPGRKTAKICDGTYTGFFSTNETTSPYVEFKLPDSKAAEFLYICFGDMPGSWAIEEQVDGQWQPLLEGSTDYHHVLVSLGGKTHFRLIDTTGKKVKMKINEVFLFGDGELPDWVQRWEPTVDKADMLLLAAHPGDELLFFGGAIPTYAVERGNNVVVALMTYSNTTRRSELLNGLWNMGIRHYPVIGDFFDGYAGTLKEAYKRWGQDETREFVTRLLRKYKPEVVVTHQVDGEYGHGAHELTADVAKYCVERAADETYLPELAKEYGVWDVKKLYLHLTPENAIRLDWNVPLNTQDGKTGLEAAKDAFTFHVTQASSDHDVLDSGRTDNAAFGLVYSAAGKDDKGGDFMENIWVQPTMRPDGTTPEPTPTPMPTPTPSPTPEPTPIPERPMALDVTWPENDVAKDEDGYPLSGEFVYDNFVEGLWFYASPTLIVRVERIFDPEAVLTTYEADIYCAPAAERFGITLHNEEKPQKKSLQTAQIAREKQVVFAMNTDYYTYRLGSKTITGMVIRGGKTFFNRVPEANRRKFPNLDTLALYDNGDWGVYHSDELTAEEYLAKGAIDVLSFGPYLVRDGEINPFIAQMTNGKTDQPRCAVGMIEPGRYHAVLAEGRIRNKSVGVSVEYLANHMLSKGCKVAFNLDGGQTAVMAFMGNQISRIGKYSGGRTSARATTEILGVGHSDLIDPNEKPFYAQPDQP